MAGIFKDADFAPEMAIVPAGAFLMGSADSEIAALTEAHGRYHSFMDEAPRHEVTFARPFAIGRYAVTVAEYLAGVKAGGCKPPAWLEEGSPNHIETGWVRRHYKWLGDDLTGERQPIAGVTWDDAKAYAEWLSEKTGKAYRLPSEAEWEYCCRAGTSMQFWWGDEISTEANYDGNYEFGNNPEGERQVVASVDSFQPNPWGLYQMHGNVWEWCEDCWNDSYRDAPSDGSAWITGECDARVLRGGSWDADWQDVRAAYRSWGVRTYRKQNLGFRLAMTLPAPSNANGIEPG